MGVPFNLKKIFWGLYKILPLPVKQFAHWQLNKNSFNKLEIPLSNIARLALYSLSDGFSFRSYDNARLPELSATDVHDLRNCVHFIESSLVADEVNILDFSSGDGVILCNLTDRGFQCVGLEANRALFSGAISLRDANHGNDTLFFPVGFSRSTRNEKLIELAEGFDAVIFSRVPDWYQDSVSCNRHFEFYEQLLNSKIRKVFFRLPPLHNDFLKRLGNITQSRIVYECNSQDAAKPLMVCLSLPNECGPVTAVGCFQDSNQQHNTKSNLISVTVDKCRTVLNFRFSGDYRKVFYYEQLEQFKNNPDVIFEDSVIRGFYQHFEPYNYEELLLGKRTQFSDLKKSVIEHGVRRLPWLEYANPKSGNFQTPLIAPIREKEAREQFARTIGAYKKMLSCGYLPEWYPDGYVAGNVLLKEDDYRFIVRLGNHRLSALSILGLNKVEVKILRERDPLGGIVRLSEIESWPQVKNGFFSRESAFYIFESFFS